VLAAASLRGRSASGPNAGERWRRLGDRVEPVTRNDDAEVSPRVPQHRGLSLHAAVAVPARDRRRLERLCRYVARPPLASDRLEEGPDGRLVLRLKTRWRDGTSHILMERSELIDRLVPLIPPPRAHQVRYHGILAPCASRRDRIVPADAAALATAETTPVVESPASIERTATLAAIRAETSGARTAPATPVPAGMIPEIKSCDVATNRPSHHRHRWAELLKRFFEIDALRCPRCGSTLRLIAAIEDAVVARRILECLRLPARAPPLEPASRAAIPADSIDPYRDTGWDFDQSRPAEEDSETY